MALEKECIFVVEETIKSFGGLDILISNAVSILIHINHNPNPNNPQGYTRFSTFSDLNAPTADDWQKCYAVNVVAQSILMRTALPTFEANAEGGVFIITSSIAGVIAGGSMYSILSLVLNALPAGMRVTVMQKRRADKHRLYALLRHQSRAASLDEVLSCDAGAEG
jgi:hypothetical protein